MTRRHLPTLLGVVLVVLGVVLYVVSRPAAGDFGWFAYTPLSNDVSPFETSGDLVLLSRGRVLGAAVAVAGLLVVTAALAYRAGRRRGSS